VSEPIDNKSAADEPIEDAVFDAYLGRQSEVSQRYRALGADEVPAALDRNVLAQARAAVAGKTTRAHKRPAWMRWTAPLALAASAVLVVSIVIRSGTQHQVSMRDVSSTQLPQQSASERRKENESPMSGAAASADAATDTAAKAEADAQPLSAPAAPPPRELRAEESVAVPSVAAERRAQAALKKETSPPASMVDAVSESKLIAAEPVVPPPAPVGAVQPTPTTAIRPATITSNQAPPPVVAPNASAERARRDTSRDLEDIIVTAQHRAESAAQGAGPRGSVPPASAFDQREPQDTADAGKLEKQRRESNPRDWLDHIRQLRKDGRPRDADSEWRRFLEAYPQFPVDAKDTARSK